MSGVYPTPHTTLELLRILYAFVALALSSCGATERYRQTEPWNFPPLHEWNAPLETSWVNAVDTYRRLTAPKGKVYDPLMRNYQPDLGALTSSNNEPENLPASQE